MFEEMKTKNEEIEGHLQESKAKIESGNNENVILKKQNEEMKLKIEKLEEERDAEKEKNIQCQSENVTNLKLIVELKTTESKLVSDLEDCKTTDADLVVSEQELKECNEEMEAEMKKNLQCESELKICENENVARNQTILELKSKTAEIESHLQETKAEVENGVNQMAILKKQNEDLKMKVEAVEVERDTEAEKGVQCQSENVKNLKLIVEMKRTESKLASELENCKTTDADLVISNQELKECNGELDSELTKNLQCESEKKTCEVEIVSKHEKILELRSKNTKVTSELESESAEHIISKKELHDCEEELEDEIQKNKNLQIQNSKSLKAIEESRSTASTNRRQAQECQNKLEDEIEAKENIQNKFESVCPSWSEWSNCSKDCGGVKTRMNKCSMDDKEIRDCDRISSCPKSGKSTGLKLFEC